MTRPLLLLCAVLPFAAGCQPPAMDTTERIIRIQIEGCEDATPLPATPTPAPIAVVATQIAAPATEAPTRVAVETPLAIQTRVPRTPEPPDRTPQQLAEDFAAKREAVQSALREAKLHPLDVPEAVQSLQRGDDFFRAKNYDEALRYAEVALLQVQGTKISEPFIEKKFKRVEARLDAMRPAMRPVAIDSAQKALSKAHQAFLTNNFRQANSLLYEVDLLLDRKDKRP